jgi:tRNA(Ile)-lysidine synthase
MAEVNGKFVRPLLDVGREVTLACCAENQIVPWSDPHNADPAYSRVRVRHEILPLMEERIGPGIVDALGRSAKILRQDSDALDSYALGFLGEWQGGGFEIADLAKLPQAVRIRVLREAIFRTGAPLGSLSADHLAPVEALITDWHGQGVISLPGGVKVERISGRLSLLAQA